MSGTGDYISREATLKRLCKEVCNVPNCECDRVRCPEWFVIHDAPAADVRPVVRARWNTVKHPLYECSNCGAVYQDVGYGFNYCPNCGADMRPEPPKEET